MVQKSGLYMCNKHTYQVYACLCFLVQQCTCLHQNGDNMHRLLKLLCCLFEAIPLLELLASFNSLMMMMHTPHCSLHPAFSTHWKLHTANYTLHTTLSILLHTALLPHFIPYTWRTTHYALHSHHTSFFTHCAPHASHSTLYTTHCTLHIPHCMLRTTHCHYALQQARC